MNSSTSVVITILNAEKHIEGCLNSLLSQQKKPSEVIIVDAGSTDKSLNIINSFSNLLNINLIIEVGCDMGRGRKIGVINAKSTYITFLDADDRFLPSHIFVSSSKLDSNPNIDYVYGNNIYYLSEFSKFGKRRTPTLPLNKDDMLRGNNFSLNSLTIRSSLLKNNNYFLFLEGQHGRFCEDWSCQLQLLLKEIPFEYISEPISLVNIRNDSHTNWKAQIKTSLIMTDILKNKLSFFTNKPLKKNEIFSLSKKLDFLSLKYILASIISKNFENLLIKDNFSKKYLFKLSKLIYFFCVFFKLGNFFSFILSNVWDLKFRLNIQSVPEKFLYKVIFK